MSRATDPLTGAQMLGELAPIDGDLSGLDTDLVRGHELQAGFPRMPVYFLPGFYPVPSFGDVMSQYTFGK